MLNRKWGIHYTPQRNGYVVYRPVLVPPGGYEYYRDILFADAATAQAVADELNEEGKSNG